MTAGAQRSSSGKRQDPAGLEELRLIRRVGEGDLQAFEELYRLYHPRLTRFLFTLSQRSQLVEEVLDDVMMVVWTRAAAFEGASKLSTWIFAIAYRKARKAMRRRDEPIEDIDLDRQPCAEDDPEQGHGRNRTRELLTQAMGSLSPEHRAVVDLTYFHEMAYREIAEILGCPTETVKTRMFYARRRLRDHLAGELSDWL